MELLLQHEIKRKKNRERKKEVESYDKGRLKTDNQPTNRRRDGLILPPLHNNVCSNIWQVIPFTRSK